jgi:hypothetical protein
MPITQSISLSTSIYFNAIENEFGNIDLFGSATGIANGSSVNLLFTDAFGNSKTVTAVVTAGVHPDQYLDRHVRGGPTQHHRYSWGRFRDRGA